MKPRNLIAVVLLCFSAAAVEADTLSRAEAVANALNANPDVLRSREQIKLLDGRIMEERAAAFPELNARGVAFRYIDPSFLNSTTFDEFPPELRSAIQPQASNIFEGALEVKQTLYSFKLGRAIRAARLARTLGAADLRRVQQKIALDTVQAYNALLFAGEQVRVARNALDRKEKHLEMTRNRRGAGVATDLDVLRAQVDVENQRAELVRAEGGIELARAQLNALMLRPMDEPITPTDKLEYLPTDMLLDDVVREALANRPDVDVAKLNVDVRGELAAVAKADSLPSLEFTGNYGHSTRKPENFFNNDFAKWNTSLTVKIPIFDGRRRAGKVAQAQAEIGKARQDRIALENQVRLEAMNTLVRLNVAGRVIGAAQMNVQQAQKALDMIQANYNYGAATVLDVTDAQNALVQAEMTLAQALQEHANARATLNYVMGRNPAEAN